MIGCKKPVLFRVSIDKVVQRYRISAFIDLSFFGMFELLPSGTWILSGWLSFSGVYVVKVSFGRPHA
jgi:hypothetical protein